MERKRIAALFHSSWNFPLKLETGASTCVPELCNVYVFNQMYHHPASSGSQIL